MPATRSQCEKTLQHMRACLARLSCALVLRACFGQQGAGAIAAEGGLSSDDRQERIARQRQRPVENKWIGQRIAEPEIDLAAMARAQGIEGLGSIVTTRD